MTPKALSREIKFRAYGTEYGGGEIKMRYSDESPDIPCFWTLYVGNKQEYAEAIMQFTGLLDKNGNEIYEGDIVKTHLGTDKRIKFLDTFEKIDFKDGCFIVNSITCKGQWNELYKETNRIEIIGNIYENPELLTKENK